MRKLIFIFILMSMLNILFDSCLKKNVPDDLSGDQYIAGRLFLLDTLTKSGIPAPLAQKTIVIGDAGSADSLNFLFSAKTDADGYFIFNNLNKGASYILRYDEQIDGIKYTIHQLVVAGEDSVALVAHPDMINQNGIHCTVLSSDGQHIKDATVCIFGGTSATGYDQNECGGSNYQLTTDAYGHASQFQIPSGTYYLLAKQTIGGVPWIAKQAVTVADQVNLITMTLSRENGVQIQTLDSLNMVLPHVNVCFFTSRALFLHDSCGGSNFQLSSDQRGIAETAAVPTGKYYLIATLKGDNVDWISRDSVVVDAAGVVSKTMVLREK